MDKLHLHTIKSPFAVSGHPKNLYVVSYSDNINTVAKELIDHECLLYSRHKGVASDLIHLTEANEFGVALTTVAFILRSLDSTSYTPYLEHLKNHCNSDDEYYQILANLIRDYIEKGYVPDETGHFDDYSPYHNFHCGNKGYFAQRYR
ncbi:hypothetical protein [uncultured Photobacterium sp.]|uniref:hypothetical protein n=1 Tax=uncultured Photobacterium sp. TaxID=173973 RepID=UPI002612E4AF|nr:hypothetical protein [uncultured Photobacterium sp.]